MSSGRKVVIALAVILGLAYIALAEFIGPFCFRESERSDAPHCASPRKMLGLLSRSPVCAIPLSDRRCVEDAAGAPQLIEAARNAEQGAGADVRSIDLAVIADVADDAHGQSLVRPTPRHRRLRCRRSEQRPFPAAASHRLPAFIVRFSILVRSDHKRLLQPQRRRRRRSRSIDRSRNYAAPMKIPRRTIRLQAVVG